MIKTESDTFSARDLWTDSIDSYIETRLADIESSEDGNLNSNAVLECYKHFHEIAGDAKPYLKKEECTDKVTVINFPDDENWTISCYLQ